METEMEIFFPGGKRVDAHYQGFTIQTDQSIDGGGGGAEPAPFALFLASIGTCAGIYVLSFCQERNIPTEGVRLIQKIERNGKSRKVEKISIEIKLPSNFPQKYRTAVVHSAQLCSVKKHMEEPPNFEVTATVAGEESE